MDRPPRPSVSELRARRAAKKERKLKEAHVEAYREANPVPEKSASELYLDLFWHLANVHEAVRHRAVFTMVKTLQEAEYKDPKSPTSKHGFTDMNETLSYTLHRLIMGLLSNRDAARQGFASALAEILKAVPIDLKEVWTHVRDEVILAKSNTDMPPKERRIGTIFAILAFVRSGAFAPALERPATTKATIETMVNMLEYLLDESFAAQPAMMEITMEAAIALFAVLPKDVYEIRLKKHIAKILITPLDDWHPEHVKLAAAVEMMFRHSVSVVDPQIWNSKESLFGPKNIKNLLKPLTSSVRTVPRLNKVWIQLTHYFAAASLAEQKSFANVIIDGLIETHEVDQGFVVLLLLNHLMKQEALEPHWIATLITPRVFDLIYTWGRYKDFRREATVQLLATMTLRTQQDPKVQYAMIEHFTGPHSNFDAMDAHFKVKFVIPILVHLPDESIRTLMAKLAGDFYSDHVPADLLPRYEIPQIGEEEDEDKSENEASDDKKDGSASEDDSDDASSDSDKKWNKMDVDVSAPDVSFTLREVKVDPEQWLEYRRKAIVAFMAKTVSVLHNKTFDMENAARLVLQLMKWLYFNSFYTCLETKADKKVAKQAAQLQELLTLPLKPIELQTPLRVFISQQFSTSFSQLRLHHSARDTYFAEWKVDCCKFIHTKHFPGIWRNLRCALPLAQFEQAVLSLDKIVQPVTTHEEFAKLHTDAFAHMDKLEAMITEMKTHNAHFIRLTALRALYSELVIHLQYETDDALQILGDLAQIFDKLIARSVALADLSDINLEAYTQKTNDSKKKKDAEKDEDIFAVLTDMLIGLVAHASPSLTAVIEDVWTAFCALLTPEAFKTLLTAIEDDQQFEDVMDEDEEEFNEEGDDASLDDPDESEIADLNLEFAEATDSSSNEGKEDGSESDEEKGENGSDKESGSQSSGSDSEDSGDESSKDDVKTKKNSKKNAKQNNKKRKRAESDSESDAGSEDEADDASNASSSASESSSDEEAKEHKKKRKQAKNKKAAKAEEEARELEAKIKQVLQEQGALAESDDDSEVDFNDTKMFKLDTGLAKVMVELHKKRLAAKREREGRMNPIELQASTFRTRLLNLLDIYITERCHFFNHLFKIASPHKEKLAKEKVDLKSLPKKERLRLQQMPKVPNPQKYSTEDNPAAHLVVPDNWSYLEAIDSLAHLYHIVGHRKAFIPLIERITASINRLSAASVAHFRMSDEQRDHVQKSVAGIYKDFTVPLKYVPVQTRITLITLGVRVLRFAKDPNYDELAKSFHSLVQAMLRNSSAWLEHRGLHFNVLADILRGNMERIWPFVRGIGMLIADTKDAKPKNVPKLMEALYQCVTKGLIKIATVKWNIQELVEDTVKSAKKLAAAEELKKARKLPLTILDTLHKVFYCTADFKDDEVQREANKKLYGAESLKTWMEQHLEASRKQKMKQEHFKKLEGITHHFTKELELGCPIMRERKAPPSQFKKSKEQIRKEKKKKETVKIHKANRKAKIARRLEVDPQFKAEMKEKRSEKLERREAGKVKWAKNAEKRARKNAAASSSQQ